MVVANSPKNPWVVGFLFSFSFPQGRVHKKTLPWIGKAFSEEDASTASVPEVRGKTRSWTGMDGDEWGVLGAECS